MLVTIRLQTSTQSADSSVEAAHSFVWSRRQLEGLAAEGFDLSLKDLVVQARQSANDPSLGRLSGEGALELEEDNLLYGLELKGRHLVPDSAPPARGFNILLAPDKLAALTLRQFHDANLIITNVEIFPWRRSLKAMKELAVKVQQLVEVARSKENTRTRGNDAQNANGGLDLQTLLIRSGSKHTPGLGETPMRVGMGEDGSVQALGEGSSLRRGTSTVVGLSAGTLGAESWVQSLSSLRGSKPAPKPQLETEPSVELREAPFSRALELMRLGRPFPDQEKWCCAVCRQLPHPTKMRFVVCCGAYGCSRDCLVKPNPAAALVSDYGTDPASRKPWLCQVCETPLAEEAIGFPKSKALRLAKVLRELVVRYQFEGRQSSRMDAPLLPSPVMTSGVPPILRSPVVFAAPPPVGNSGGILGSPFLENSGAGCAFDPNSPYRTSSEARAPPMNDSIFLAPAAQTTPLVGPFAHGRKTVRDPAEATPLSRPQPSGRPSGPGPTRTP
jgi:hypothetical protein